MTEQEKQEIIQSIDLDSIAESVRTACIGCLTAMEEYVVEAKSIRDLILNFATYTGNFNDLFKKAINGLDCDAVEDFVLMYNHFSYYSINYIYEIKKEVYNYKKMESKNE